VLVRNSYE